jgi:AraC-like DNA-binding protein
VIHLKKGDAVEAVLLEHIVGLINHELTASRPGMRGIVNRLVEILFIQVVRVRLAETCDQCGGSIRGMLHPDLGAALVLIHDQPEKSWTVAELADRATMSRSAFSATFAKVLGKPPLQYLRQRRMLMACRLLRNPTIGLNQVASRVGYDSVSAFSTAFKRFSGMSPGDYRRRETRSGLTYAAASSSS